MIISDTTGQKLTRWSKIVVTVKCDTCGTIYDMAYRYYAKKKDKATCIKCGESAVKTIEFIKAEFDKRGYDLLTTEYVNAHQHLEYCCRKHPEQIQTIIYNSLQRGCGCAPCGLLRRGKARQLTIDKARVTTENRGYKFVGVKADGRILNSKTYIRYVCPNHQQYIQEMRYNNLQQGFGCPFCYAEKKKFAFIKDGKTPIKEYLRPHVYEWIALSKELSNDRCIFSGDTNYDIHHMYPFEKILQEAFVNTQLDRRKLAGDYTTDELQLLINELNILHVKYGPGICLASPLHSKLHSMYGAKSIISNEQFDEFCRLYRDGLLFEKNPDYYIDFD